MIEKIGAGGMGEVYLAEDTQLGRRVAIKLLPSETISDEHARKRLVREARAAATLDHPNICSVYEVGEADGRSFIAMQYVEGETLDAKLKRKALELKESLAIASQIADALAEAHAHGIVHRDIKPGNIMITSRGQAKVMDFGLSKVISKSQVVESEVETEALLSTPGAIMGTVPYMSPEQVKGKALDGRSDIFSFGVMLYEMLSGQQPFAGESSAATASAILTREPPPLARYSREIPAELERIVSKALRKDLDERYQTAKDLQIDLRDLQKHSELTAELERLASASKQSEAATGASKAETRNSIPLLPFAETNTNPETTLRDKPKANRALLVSVLLGSLLIAAIGVGYWVYGNRHAPIESIAVLPFVNASGNSELEYLSDGLTESLITSLSQLPKLSVKARSSVFRYKGKDAPPQQVGKELNVQAILNGRVVQRGNDLTLHIELVDVNTETALWSGDYNRSMTNLVSLPSEIARDVSSKLRLTLSGPDEQKLAKNYTANTEAYQLYLKGRYHVFKITPPEVQKGISYFQQAIEIDPSYALAYVGLSGAYRSFSLSFDMPSTEGTSKAKDAAQKAVEIDDTLAEAHAALGFAIFWYDWDFNAAEAQLKRALELNPNSADAHWAYGAILSTLGRYAEALAE
ncbi:MAG TPA: protein kinase, partial [Pyrinomonadaceae bacterium]|nr:protein kinase [Pyrinomonadaceae bacterium]